MKTPRNLLIWGFSRARWARAEPGPAALRECLDAVDDRAWAVRECLARLAPDAAAQAALIKYGLAETVRQCQSAAAEPSGRGADAGAAREVRDSFAWFGNADMQSITPPLYCLYCVPEPSALPLRLRTAKLMCLGLPFPHTHA